MDWELRRVGIDEETELKLRQAAEGMGQSFDLLKRAILDAFNEPLSQTGSYSQFPQGLTSSFTNDRIEIGRMFDDFAACAARERHRTGSRFALCWVPLEELAADPPPIAFIERAGWRRLTTSRGRRPLRARPGGGARGILRRAA